MGRKSDARKRLMEAVYELISKFSYGAVTVEAICHQAGVKKGSFYHFFDSKSDLAAAAITAWWDERRSMMEKVFQPEIPPLDRIRNYLDIVAQSQMQSYEKSGQILGGPVFRLGSEISTQDERLRLLVHGIITRIVCYFEEAIGEAQTSGQVEGEDAALKARLLWGFYAGTIIRARIENNPELIRTLSSDALELIRPSLLDTIALG